MKNFKSLQMGGQPNEQQEVIQIAQEIKNSVEGGVQSIQDVIFDILQAGQDANTVGMALMQLGYEQEDVISLFQSIAAAEEAQQQQPGMSEQPMQQEMTEEQMMEDAPMAKMGMQIMSNKKKDSFKDWYKQLGGGTHNTYYAQRGYEVPGQEYMDMQGYGEMLSNMGIVGDTYDDLYDATDERNTQAFNDAMDFSQDLSQSNLVNKGSMGIQPSTGYEGPSPQKNINNKIQNPFSTAVSGLRMINNMISSEGNPNDIYNDLIADQIYSPAVNKLSYGKDDVNTGKDFSGLRVPFIGFGQEGMEMSMQANNYIDKLQSDDLYQAQYGIDMSGKQVYDIVKGLKRDGRGLYKLDDVQTLEDKKVLAALNRKLLKDKGVTKSAKEFVEREMGKPDANVQYIYTQDRTTSRANDIPTGPLSDTAAQAYQQDFLRQNQLDSIPGVTSGPKYTGYTGPMYQDGITLPKNQNGKEFVEKELGDPNQVVYRNDNLIDKRYNINPFYKPTPDELQAINQYYYALFEQDKKLKEKPGVTSGPRPSMNYREALSRPFGERKYGGHVSPFSKKRSLRKKRGGQIAKVGTEVLKKLLAKGAKFDKL